MRGRLLEAQDQRPQLGQAQPVRHDPAQHPALATAEADIWEVLKTALVTKPYDEIVAPVASRVRSGLLSTVVVHRRDHLTIDTRRCR